MDPATEGDLGSGHGARDELQQVLIVTKTLPEAQRTHGLTP